MTVQNALRDINNAILDLQSADYNTFERPLERLSYALNSSELKSIADDLKAKTDFDKFLENADSGGSLMGTARLSWPPERENELGLTIHLIERSAKDPHWFLNFAHTYYYSGRKFVGDIRKITAAVFIPFNRDFASYADEFIATLAIKETKKSITIEADKDELLHALFKLAQATGKRPSVQNAGTQYFPDWDRDRLFNAAQSLEKEGAILNPTGAMVYVDLSSSARKRVEQNGPAATSVVNFNVEAMNNSPFQYVASGGSGTQTTTYSNDALNGIVALYRDNIDGLGLDAAQRRRADAQVATIEAQLIDEPDSTIINAAGKSLKSIIEGALGGAAGNLLTSASVWAPLLSMFS